MTTASFTRVARVTANTKRAPVISSGKAGTPASNLTGIKITEPVLADDAKELRETYGLATLANIMQCFCQGDLDIITGDTLSIPSGTWAGDYPIRLVQSWPFGGDIRKRLIYEALKR